MAFRAVRRRSHEDDAAFLLKHTLRCLLSAEEHAVEVDVDDLLPLLVSNVREVGADADAGVRYKNVYAAELGVHLRERRLHVPLFAHVTEAVPSKVRILCHYLLDRVFVIVDDKYL